MLVFTLSYKGPKEVYAERVLVTSNPEEVRKLLLLVVTENPVFIK